MQLIKNNKGMSLMELIISMAITAIILSMIVVVINTAANSYRHTNEKVNLQMEAQRAMNQLSTLVMEASDILPSTDTALTASDVKYLIKGSTDCYAVYYKKDKNRLYLITAATTAAADVIDPAATTETENQYLMAEYVADFQIDYADKEAKLIIEFAIGDTSEYEVEKKVLLRNAK